MNDPVEMTILVMAEQVRRDLFGLCGMFAQICALFEQACELQIAELEQELHEKKTAITATLIALSGCLVIGKAIQHDPKLGPQSNAEDFLEQPEKNIQARELAVQKSVNEYRPIVESLAEDGQLFTKVNIDEQSDLSIEITVGPAWDTYPSERRAQVVSKMWWNWNELCVCNGQSRGWVKYVYPTGEVIGRAGDNSGEFLVFN